MSLAKPIARNVSSASSELRHPTPDLHTLHAAHLKHVQQLERSAEELSAGGSDIGEEIRKMNESSRQSSIQSSHHGDFSLVRPAHVERVDPWTSGGRASSTRSVRTTQSSFARRYDEIAGQIQDSLQHVPPSPPKHHPRYVAEDLAMPPPRSRSTDTFQEAQAAFRDFDGVHFSPEMDQGVELDEDGCPVRRSSARGSSGAASLDAVSLLRAPPAPPGSQVLPPPDQGMIYYPAPVPKLLNLPKRLSQLPAATVQSKRKSEMLHQMSHEAGAAAPWLSPENVTIGEAGISQPHSGASPSKRLYQGVPTKSMSSSTLHLPPQARADLFFRHSPVQHDIEVKSGSAVATLDSILAASANAPVNAFTDHPLAGNVLTSVYSVEHKSSSSVNGLPIHSSPDKLAADKRRSVSISNLLPRSVGTDDVGVPTERGEERKSTMSDGFYDGPKAVQRRTSRMSLGEELDDAHEKLEQPDQRSKFISNALIGETRAANPASEGVQSNVEEDTVDTFEETEELDDTEELHGDPIFVKPSTLLAELQVRKAQQKSRTRTAATNFPNGMHSTLLQMDAVEEIAKKNRKGQRVGLAWEIPPQGGSQQGEGPEDEDVPLAMLFPSKDGQTNRRVGDGRDWDRPLGLMERRHLEDEEPLSSRRNRLRSGSPRKPNPSHVIVQPDSLSRGLADDDHEEHETLAQRLRRLKMQNASGTAVDDLAMSAAHEVNAGFVNDVLRPFALMTQDGDVDGGEKTTTTKPGASPASEEEETLGQRKLRLRREREANGEQRGAPDPRKDGSVYKPAEGTLLYANAEVAAKQRLQLQNTNMRASSYHLDRPLVDASLSPHVSRGLLANRDSRASGRGLSAYNNGTGGIQLP